MNIKSYKSWFTLLKKFCFHTKHIFETAHTLIEVLQLFKTFSPLTFLAQIFAMVFVWKIKHKALGPE